MQAPLRLIHRSAVLWCCILLVTTFAATGANAQGNSGSTLQASKTLDICDNGDGTWKYSGEVSVWNTGANTAQGLNITDCLQYKAPGQSGQPKNKACLSNVQNNPPSGPTTSIPGLTQETEALRFSYDFTGVFTAPLDVTGTIRNSAQVNITNHSGGQVSGPNPKTTWTGGTPPACVRSCGCTFTQGYWDNKPDVVWPTSYDDGTVQLTLGRDQLFFNSGLTWQQILDASVEGGNAYINLAHQYIAAVLNVANGACEPDSVKQLVDQSTAFFQGFTLGSDFCSSSITGCPLQVTWAGILADYNQRTGSFVTNPGHCSE